MRRLTAQDASFLYSEDGKSHNDIGMVLVFDGPAMSRDELMAVVAGRLPLIPRFRQKLRHLPYGVALPVWVDDVGFDLHRHVIEHPAVPDGPDPVGQAVSTVMSGALDLNLPLWQIHLFAGLPENRWLVIVRMHHAMVDGVTSTEIIRVLLSPKPEGEPPVPDHWRPAPEPTGVQLLAGAAADAGKAAAQMFTSMLAGARMPAVPNQPVDLGAVLRPGIPIRGDVINGPVESGRRFSMTAIDLATIKVARARYGGTVNDVILAACARGFSELIASRGATVQGRVLRALVPVSLHAATATQQRGPVETGNEVGAMIIELPLGDLPGPARLARIREQTQTFKQLKDALPAPAINPGSELISPLTLMLGTRMAAQAPVVVNTVITNVPGPQTPLYLAGRRMHRLAACIALWTPLRVAVSALSYDGVVTIGVVTDASSFPKVDPLPAAIAAGIDELAGSSSSPTANRE